MVWEMVLTTGLVSVILGTASGAQQVGAFAAIGVGSYIALAGLWGSPVSGASMNPARSLGPALVLGDWTAWWAYLAGPAAGGLLAVGIAQILRGPGGGMHGRRAAQGTLGTLWLPGQSEPPAVPPEEPGHSADRPSPADPPGNPQGRGPANPRGREVGGNGREGQVTGMMRARRRRPSEIVSRPIVPCGWRLRSVGEPGLKMRMPSAD